MRLAGLAVAAVAIIAATSAAAAGKEHAAAALPVIVSDNKPVQLELIDAATTSGKLELARGLIERAKRAGQDGPALDLRLAEFWLASGAVPQAAAAFEKLAADPLYAAAAWQGVGLTALAEDHTKAAAEAFEKAVAAGPNQPRAWAGLAVTADQRGDWTKAEAAYARALSLAPGNAVTLSNRGYSRILQARYNEAVVDLTEALRIAPTLSTAVTNRRLALAMAGNYGAAFAGSDKHQIARDLNTVGFGAMLRGDYAAAEGYFTRAIQINPEFDRTAFRNLGYLKSLTPRPETAARGN